MPVASQAMRMGHTGDPKTELLDRVGRLDEVYIGGQDVLVAIYEGAEKTSGGIILPDSKKDENKYQGKVGLVLKLGPMAYAEGSESHRWFGDNQPQVGDWVVFNVNTAFPFIYGKQTLRLVEAQYIRAVVPIPDIVL